MDETERFRTDIVHVLMKHGESLRQALILKQWGTARVGRHTDHFIPHGLIIIGVSQIVQI